MIKDWQIKLIFIVGVLSVLIVFLFDFRGILALVGFIVSFALILGGNKLLNYETTENWLKFQMTDILRQIIGGVFILFGGVIFVRLVLSLAIAVIISKIS